MSVKSAWIMILAAIVFIAVPTRTQGQMNSKAPIQLPDGDGKASSRPHARCATVWATLPTRAGHTPEEWKTTLAMMLNVGAPVPKDKVDIVQDYLIKNFPEQPSPAGDCPG